MGDARSACRRWAAAFKIKASDLACVRGVFIHAQVEIDEGIYGKGWRPSAELQARVDRLEHVTKLFTSVLEREFEEVAAQAYREGGWDVPPDEQPEEKIIVFNVATPVEFISLGFKIEGGQVFFEDEEKKREPPKSS